jgi:hypothetical protein
MPEPAPVMTATLSLSGYIPLTPWFLSCKRDADCRPAQAFSMTLEPLGVSQLATTMPSS